MTPVSSRPAPWPRWAVPLAVALAALLLQLPLILNPGYFSHDELQWAAAAVDGRRVDWLDIGILQYRPLTFELWLALSRAFFRTPQLFHLTLALLGAANAVLLGSVLLRAGVEKRTAGLAALFYIASPYAMYVHGWIGTLGDILWVGLGLLAGWSALRMRAVPAAVVAAVCTAFALLAKEAALSLPAIAAVLWLLDAPRRRTWLAVGAGATLAAVVYLVLRWPALTAGTSGTSYAWSLLHIPARWLEYQLYLPNPPVFEVHNVHLGGMARKVVAAVLWLGLLAVLARAGVRFAIAFVLGGIAALGPVLVLAQPATQYGYGMAAWSAGVIGMAWPHLPRMHRLVVAAFALLAALHGVNVAREMLRVGRVQSNFSPAMAAAVSRSPGVVRFAPGPGADEWIFLRLSHNVPHYAGVPLGTRVEVVKPDAPADYRILPDGQLEPIR